MPIGYLLIPILLLCLFAGHFALAGTNDPTTALQKGLFEEEANHDLNAAIQEYQVVITRFDQDRKIAATAIFRLGECYRKQGNTNEANAQFQRIVREFPDQTQLAALSRQYLPANQSAGYASPEERSQSPSGGHGAVDLSGMTPDETAEALRIQAMIKDSPDLINAGDSQPGGTPLHRATAKGELTVAKFLLTNGANVDARDQNGRTPLLSAASGGHKALVELLLAYKANVQAIDPGGWTALHLAAEHGFKNVVEVLLAHGADINAQTKSGDSPLLMASINGFNSVAALLLGHGANPDSQGWYNVESWSNNHYNPGKSSVGGVQNYCGTALHIAAQRGDLALAQVLLTNKANLNATNDSGQTPLGAAADKGQLAVADLLLSRGADVNARNADPGMEGWTPLHYAVSRQWKDLVRLLLKRKADPNARLESPAGVWSKGETPLLMACFFKSTDIVGMLLEAHADPNLTDDNGSTPICYTLAAGEISKVTEFPGILKLLLEHGANVNARDPLERTPLMLAAQQREAVSLKVLLGFKADVNARSKSGSTALHFLIQGGPQPGRPQRPVPVPGGFGTWPPSLASDLPEMLTALLDAGANANAQDSNGKTPLNYVPRPAPAEEASNWAKIDQLLRQHGAVEDLPDFSAIRVTRTGVPQSWVVLQADTNRLNRFTLMELILNYYHPLTQQDMFEQDLRRSGNRTSAGNFPLAFPDFSRVKILRPVPDKPGERKETILSLLTGADKFDCAKDVRVDFGDIVQIPEREHPLSEPPTLLTQEQRFELENCLSRKVVFRVKGQPTEVSLAGYTGTAYLSRALSLPQVQKVLRSSSDLARLTVKRAVQETSEVKAISESVLPYWNNKEPLQDDLWLREGDVVEVPDKP